MFPFSPKGYKSLLQFGLKNGYTFSTIRDARKTIEKKKTTIILRHDIDLSLDPALAMAQIEHDLNIQSTYFILLFNDFYNPFSPENRKKVKKLKELGHEVGFHWDARDYEFGDAKKKFRRNLELLSELIEEKIISGAQHEPNFTIRSEVHTELKYESYRDFKDITYVSDSTMRWRQHTPWELMEKKITMQFLAHPFWWIVPGKTREDKFKNLFKQTQKESKKIMDEYYTLIMNFLKKTS